MADAMSDYLENAVLNYFLRAVAPTPTPSTVYLALHTANPGESGSASEVVNAGGSTYSRKAVTFSNATTGSTSNSAQIDFTNMPACNVSHVSIKDASTGGNTLFYGALVAPKSVNLGDTFTVNAGDLTITLA